MLRMLAVRHFPVDCQLAGVCRCHSHGLVPCLFKNSADYYPRQEGYVFAFVNLSVSRITEEVVCECRWKYCERWNAWLPKTSRL